MPDQTKPYTYVGNPGYVFPTFGADREGPYQPGDRVELTADEAKGAGEDFEPVKTAKTAKTTEES